VIFALLLLLLSSLSVFFFFFFFVGGFQGLQSMAVRGSLISVDGNSRSLLLLNHNLEFLKFLKFLIIIYNKIFLLPFSS
jgi:hypothetical protein